MEAKNLTIEDNKKVEVIPFTQHSTLGIPKPKPSPVVGKCNPQLQPVHIHFPANYLLPDNPPQDVDKPCHLSDSPSITDSLDESSTLIAQDDHLLQLNLPASQVNSKTPLLLKLNLFINLKDN